MASVRAAVGASLAVARTRPRCVGLALPSSAPRSAWAAAMEPTPRWLAGLRFDNRALRELPVETPPPGPEDSLATPRPVPGACFSRARPAPLRRPRLVALSEPALALLGLEASEEAEVEAEAALFFSGNALLPGTEPAAHCYCGHQFGQFAGQLGDGAAMYLGEVCTAAGERWELQLKGAGPTPFSRQADGRKVLRSSIREFLCSEAMFHLGIPTTRAGACVTSESTVMRDVFYDDSAPLKFLSLLMSTQGVQAPAWDEMISESNCLTMSSALSTLEELRLAFRPQMDPRQLSMMLMLAQSNPQLFALIGTQANVTKELERVEHQSRLEQLSPSDLQRKNRDHWEAWLQEYRDRLDKEKEGVGDTAAWQAERVRVMRANNPKYVLSC